MAAQQQIAYDHGDSLIGSELDVLIDSQVDDQFWLGRTYADAPEIDGNVYVSGDGINVGDFVPVEMIERRDYDLVGVYEPDDN